MRESGQEPCPPAGGSALYSPFGHAKYLRRVSDRVAEHVDQDQRSPLVRDQLAERRHHVHRSIRGARRIGQWLPASHHGKRVERFLVLTGGSRSRSTAAHPIKRGIHHNPVQPGRNRGVATETSGSPEGCDHCVLESVCRFLGVTQSADRHRPQPVPMALEKLAESVGVAIDVALKQLSIRGILVMPQGMPHVTWVPRLWQGVAAGCLIGFRGSSPRHRPPRCDGQ
jgi:hypothetical protein